MEGCPRPQKVLHWIGYFPGGSATFTSGERTSRPETSWRLSPSSLIAKPCWMSSLTTRNLTVSPGSTRMTFGLNPHA